MRLEGTKAPAALRLHSLFRQGRARARTCALARDFSRRAELGSAWTAEGGRPHVPRGEVGSLISLAHKFANRLIGVAEGLFIGQEDDAKVLGIGLLAKAGAMDDEHVFLNE